MFVLALAYVLVLPYAVRQMMRYGGRLGTGIYETNYFAANLVLITLDTVRADRLGCYGYEKAETPWLDRLAEEGIRFAQASAAVPFYAGGTVRLGELHAASGSTGQFDPGAPTVRFELRVLQKMVTSGRAAFGSAVRTTSASA